MNTNISSNARPEDRFFAWVDTNIPYMGKLFNYEERRLLPEMYEGYLSHASTTQRIMAQFVVGVWKHESDEFDLMEATKLLHSNQIKIITDWMLDPIWP